MAWTVENTQCRQKAASEQAWLRIYYDFSKALRRMLICCCYALTITCVHAGEYPHTVLVKLNPQYQTPDKRQAQIEALTKKYAVSFTPAFLPANNNNPDHSSLSLWYRVTSASALSVQTLKTQLQGESAIALAGFDQPFATTAVTPNDPYLEQQWSLVNTPNNWANGYPSLAPTEAWELETGSADVIVAVLDTGVDYTHEDLKANMWINELEANGIENFDDDGNGCVDDIYGCDFRSNVKDKIGYYPGLGGAFYNKEKYIYPDGMGHGTMVAGIIGAVGNNNIGIAGISWHARIMAVKFINQNNVANMLDAAIAIKYAVDNGARIINNSYGRQRVDAETVQIIEDAIQYANDHGVLMVASAGNSGVDIDHNNAFYPANSRAENLITVAALDQDNHLWDASNYGELSVDIAAPGVGIWTTVPAGATSLFRKYYDPSGYMQSEGTSIAAPFVTGVAALLFSHFPGITHHQVKQLILGSADYLPELNNKVVTGGRVNLYNALSSSY